MNGPEWRTPKVKAKIRFPRETVLSVHERLMGVLDPHISRYAYAGSYRRGLATCGDADLLVIPRDIENARAAVRDLASRVVYDGPSMLYVYVGEVPAQVFMTTAEHWGAALQYTTGSREHNLAVRRWAKVRGLTASQYGVKPRGTGSGYVPGSGETESGFYRALGLRWVRPENRVQRPGTSTGVFPLSPEFTLKAMRQSGTRLAQGDGRGRVALTPAGVLQPADRLTPI